MNAPQLPLERRLYLALAVLLAVLWIAGLGQRPLFNPDEGRYAEIPREMLASGDFVLPHLNGLVYAEKPPLQYWATALSLRAFGLSAFAARLYEALTALATLGVVWALARYLGGEAAAWRAGFMLAGMFMFAVLGHLLTLDMSLTFYLTLSVMGFVFAQAKGEGARIKQQARFWMLIAWGAAALGVMTKGIVAAAIPTAVLIIYSLSSRDFTPWRRLQLPAGLTLFLVITVPWHVLAALRDPDFLTFYFVHEHLARYLTPVAQRVEPWWFFIAVFVAGSVPWTWSALRVLALSWRRTASVGFDAQWFLWIWVIFVGVFFSLSDSKLMPYILPVMPAMALLIGLSPPKVLRRDYLVTAGLTLMLGAALAIAYFRWPVLLAASNRASYFLPLNGVVGKVAVLLIVTGAYVLAQGARDITRAAVLLGTGWCLAWVWVGIEAAAVAPIYSGDSMAKSAPDEARTAPFYSVGTYDQTLPFYLERTVTLVHFRGELDYGLKKNPGVEIPDLEEFERRWRDAPQAFAVMEPSMYENLKAANLPMRVTERTAGRLMVARQ